MKLPGYTLKRKLGQGGMAAVYLAEQESFGREVALKLLAPQLAREPGFAERFQSEARTVARLSHPHIITVYDVGVFQHYHYFAMEYHTGNDLTLRLHQGLSAYEALRITRELADALAFAHERDVIHRDIKPDNVLFRAHNNAAILSDFGIAKNIGTDNGLTQVGSTVGTPKYMSPEQARGQQLDGRADLYSLGVVLYEMLTGRLPYMADEPLALAMKHCNDPIPTLPGELSRYQDLINRLLAKNPRDRFAGGQELMAAIDALLKPAVAATPTQRPSPGHKPHAPASPAAASAAPRPQPAGKPVQPYQAFYGTEESVRGKFPFKRYGMQARFSADDYEEFKSQFQKLLNELRAWLDLRGKKAELLDLSIQTHPWIQNRIKEVLNKGREENTAFSELIKQAEVRIHLYDELDATGQEWAMSAPGGKPVATTPAKA